MEEVTEDFSNAPVSIAELRANKHEAAREWSARDALISVLRDIDSGKLVPPDTMVICMSWRDSGDGMPRTTYTCSGDNAISMFGTVEMVKIQMSRVALGF